MEQYSIYLIFIATMILGYKRIAGTSTDWPPGSRAEICLEVDSIFVLIQFLRPTL